MYEVGNKELYKVPGTMYKVEIRIEINFERRMSNSERRRKTSNYPNSILGTLYLVLGTIKAEKILLLESPTWYFVLRTWYKKVVLRTKPLYLLSK